jgi:hypothetical protein
VAIGFSCLIVAGVATMALRERAGVRKAEGRH